MRIHWIQHVPFEGLGSIEGWAGDRGHELVATRLWDQDPLPDPREIEFLIVMGGPMGVNDEATHNWLASEKALIGRTIESGSSVLGICLGAQLIASAMGAEVSANRQKEIGWFPVTLAATAGETELMSQVPREFKAFHWHGDTFQIPDGATHIASSAACRNQAFCINDRVLGLQFHIETLAGNVEALIENCSDELVDGEWIQSPDEMREGIKNSRQGTEILSTILDRLA
ncbi:MAG: amidotransferase [Acidobacteria bacterium]|nr:MAG: amidotransferase [Acidobacteriota bacterium]